MRLIPAMAAAAMLGLTAGCGSSAPLPTPCHLAVKLQFAGIVLPADHRA